MDKENLNSINPFVRTVSLHPYYWRNAQHTVTYDARLFYIHRGSGTLSVNHSENYSLSESNMFIIPPGNSYNFDFIDDDPFQMFIVSFDFNQDYKHLTETIPNGFEGSFVPERIHKAALPAVFGKPIYIESIKSILPQLFDMLQEYRLKNAFYRDKMSVLLKSILIDAARREDKTALPVTKPVQQLLNYIHVHFEQNITYDTISEAFSYHPYYLNRRFKQEVGMTIGHYLQEYRLTIASQLIITTNLTFEEIAYQTGFKNPSHFSAAFKRQFHRSPGDYRRYFSKQ